MKTLRKILKKSQVGWITGKFHSNYSPNDIVEIKDEVLESGKPKNSDAKSFRAVLKLGKKKKVTIDIAFKKKNFDERYRKRTVFPKNSDENDICILYHNTGVEIWLLFNTRVDLTLGKFYAYQNGMKV